MKKLIIVIVAFFLSMNLYAEGGEFEGVFKGVNENDEFVFQLDSGEKILMQDIDYDIEIDLFDKDLVGKKYKVTWELFSDEEDEDSPEIKKIIALVML